jgi:hypothetical protein
LSKDDAIEVDDAKPGGGDLLPGDLQHFTRVASAISLLGVGKQLANVAQRGGSQQGVGDGVQQDIGIAMADQVLVVGDVDPAEPERSARRKPMSVVPDSNPWTLRGLISWWRVRS